MWVSPRPARRVTARRLATFARTIATCGLVAVLLPAASAAQQHRFGQPIYPAYMGFLDNPDGSVTMVFQYFSHGRDTVTVPAGERNQFPGVADRNQPTTFEPGNHEFVCVMVVENREVAKTTRWTLAFPDAPSSTSLDPLNDEYKLTERSREEAKRALDPATAPRGMCVNKPPRVLPNIRRPPTADGSLHDGIEEVTAQLGKELDLLGSAEDEGLPRGSSVTSTWRQASGPGKATFADPSKPRTKVSFDVAGTYELELHATDGTLESADRIRVVVKEG